MSFATASLLGGDQQIAAGPDRTREILKVAGVPDSGRETSWKWRVFRIQDARDPESGGRSAFRMQEILKVAGVPDSGRERS